MRQRQCEGASEFACGQLGEHGLGHGEGGMVLLRVGL